MADPLFVDGSAVTVDGVGVDFGPHAGTVGVVAQSAFVALTPIPSVLVTAQSAFVVMLTGTARRRTGPLIA